MTISLEISKKRSFIIQKIRDFFIENDFLEVETPILTPIPGMEPHLTPFETTLTPPFADSFAVYLNTSPELQMKKLLGATLEDGSSAGFDKIFNITKVFRNGEMDGPLHNPEFTMLEWYRKNTDYIDLMNDCENLILMMVSKLTLKSQLTSAGQRPSTSAQSVNLQNYDNLTASGNGTSLMDQSTLIYQFSNIDLTTPWPRFTTNELFIKYCGIDLLENQDFATFKKTIDELAARNSILSNSQITPSSASATSFTSSSISPFTFDSSGCTTWDDLYFKIFLNYIEPELAKSNQPIFIYDYPASQATLSKKSQKNAFFAERFELYIKGIELANAFSELTDKREQRERLKEERLLRQKLGKTVFPIDEEFLQALDKITVPCAGIALGLDRLLMILLDKKSIEEVLLFPMNNMIHQN
ncbi:EF-P lysine aminoacylase GenX [Candidatus Peregrinibacteria bacterium]|nr:EF-P lysine aminoacylase GenX [Candidatus Peregrinibacteria bacterium]